MSDKIDPFENVDFDRDEYGYSDEETYLREDNPFWDGTDGAHPAWWRGEKRGAESVLEVFDKIVNAPIGEFNSGFFSNVLMNKLKKQILDMRKQSSFEHYAEEAHKLAIWPQEQMLYPVLGLAEEAGEVVGKFKKMLRDDDGVMTNERREAIIKELGDTLWYLNEVAIMLNSSLTEVAEVNLLKLSSRAKNNTIKGSGDDR